MQLHNQGIASSSSNFILVTDTRRQCIVIMCKTIEQICLCHYPSITSVLFGVIHVSISVLITLYEIAVITETADFLNFYAFCVIYRQVNSV